MAKAKNAKKTEDPAPTLVVEPVKAASAEKKAKRASKKAGAPVEAAPVEAAPSTENLIVENVNVVLDATGLTENFTEFMAKFQTLVSSMSALRTEFRALEKKALRELKAAQKANAKRKRKSGNRSPSGFVKPTLISAELAKFLGKPHGTEMARTEVTREINGYIREHSLQDKANGRKINPDKNLAALLKIGKDEELTYFNLQRYMSPHFAKATPKVVAVEAPVVVA